LGAGGGSKLAEYLRELREEVQVYFQAILAVADGMPIEVPKKPAALIQYDQCIGMGIPLVSGGLKEQPHIWLLEFAICQQERETYTALRKATRNANQHQQAPNLARSLSQTLGKFSTGI
jgi:hypothetical protein